LNCLTVTLGEKQRAEFGLPTVGISSMSTLIMKFGGTSVGMTTGLTQLLSIVLYERERWQRLLLVVSALEGVTDALIEAAHLAQLSNRRGYRRIVATLRTRHLALIEHLPLGANERGALQADIDRLLFDMLDLCQALSDKTDSAIQPETLDAIVSVGERLAARIVAALLRQNNLRGVAIDATDLIITDTVHGNATPNLAITRERIAQHLLPMLERDIIPVITGFIGATSTGKPTTLGRGGSDYTASVLSACIDASEVWIWTDVEGMMTTDPREIPEARVIPMLSYQEVAELAYFGARILHPRMIGPLRERHIPLRVRSIFRPQTPGTLIHDDETTSVGAVLKAVTAIQGIGLSSRSDGPLADIFAQVDASMQDITGMHAEVLLATQSSAQSFITFIVPTSAGPDAPHSLQLELEKRLAHLAPNWLVHTVSVVTVIGAHLDERHDITASAIDAVNGVRLFGVVYNTSRCSLSVIIDPNDAHHTLRQLHTLVLRSDLGSGAAPTA
jgi:aspartokinase/homoserine dehydrogenase 1